MQILRLDRTYHNIGRLRQVVTVLIKYGLGDVVSSLRLHYYLGWVKRFFTRGAPPKEVAGLTRPMRVRKAIEELGPTFIKLGQMLSNRPDVIPTEYASEMTRLLDRVAPVNVDLVRARIEAELGRPVRQMFAEFSAKPDGSASVAQVHSARLISGEEVVVKVIRPGIENTIRTDIDILTELARLAERHFPELQALDLVGVVEEFSRSIRKELDLIREGRLMQRFAANFEGDHGLRVPKVYWDYTSQKVLTQEKLTGRKLSEVDFASLSASDRKWIADEGSRIVLKQVLIDGLFHGDPHAGNVFIMDDHTLGLVDYGLVGRLTLETKALLIEFLKAIAQNKPERAATIWLESQVDASRVNRNAFVRDMMDLTDLYVDTPLKNIIVSSLFSDLMELMGRHSIRLPRDLILLLKALVTIEGTGRRLDPEFNMMDIAKPFVEKLIKEGLSFTKLASGAADTLDRYAKLAKTLPRDISAILKRLKESQMEIGFVHKGLEGFSAKLEKIGLRLTLGLIISALIVGSSLLMSIDVKSSAIGFVVAIVLSVVLLLSFVRS